MTKKLTSIITITLLLLLTLFSCDGLLPKPETETESASTSDNRAILSVAQAIRDTHSSSYSVPYNAYSITADNVKGFLGGATINGNLSCETYSSDEFSIINGTFTISGAQGAYSTYNGKYILVHDKYGNYTVTRGSTVLDEDEKATILEQAIYFADNLNNKSVKGTSGRTTDQYRYTYDSTVKGTVDVTVVTNYKDGYITSQYITVPAKITYNGNEINTTIYTERKDFDYNSSTIYEYTYKYQTWYNDFSLNGKKIDTNTIDERVIDIIGNIINSAF